MDDQRQLASLLTVEDRDQTLPAVPLHGAFGGDPVRAASSTGAGGAMRDIEDHRIPRRSVQADRRALLCLHGGGGNERQHAAYDHHADG
jgi:hypothetical protein